MSGGFAGGLAQGITNGIQLHFQQQYLDQQKQHQDRLAKSDERDAEIHGLKVDQYNSEKAIRDKRNNALQEIADYTSKVLPGNAPAAPAQPSAIQDPNAPSFAAPPTQQTPSSIKLAGPLPQGGLSMSAPSAPFAADNPAGALAPTAPQSAQPMEKPGQVLAQGMVTGAYSPEMLTNIANIFAKHGLHDEGTKYMEQAYTAQKRGMTQAAMALIQNNPGAAVATLKQGGINVTDMPVKVKPGDPNDHNWKLNIDGQGEKIVNVKDLLQSTMDPEKFFEAEDKKREATLKEQKQANDNRLTDAQIGYLRSRSTLADAKAGNVGVGGLKPSRSSEAQIGTALSRRDKAFDRVSSVKNEEGKFEVDPQKRQELDSASNQYQNFLEDQLGEELDSRQHNKFTDAMATFPINGTPAQEKEWREKQLYPRFGIKRSEAANQPGQQAAANPAAASQGLAPAAPAAPPAGSLASLQERGKALQAINVEMAGVQQALKNPNLNVEQKKALSLKAQEIAIRRDALKSGRAPSSDPEAEPAPDFGKRRDGTNKGTGFLGIQKTASGNDMTEYTVGLNINGKDIDVPTLVPGLTQKELDYLKTEPNLRERTAINNSIIRKAEAHARKRLSEGKSVFAN